MILDDKYVVKEAINVLNQELESLDNQTLQRLRNARVQVLSQQQDRFGQFKNSTPLKWLTGAGAGLVIASALIFMIAPNILQSNQILPLDDLEMLTSEADMDVVNQLEFYEWLDESFDEGS